MMHRQTGSLLFRLPGELRNTIYDLTFRDTIAYVKDCQRPTSQKIGLLLTCKRAHSEAIGIYYKQTTFKFPYMDVAFTWIGQYKARKYASLVKKVHFIIYEWHAPNPDSPRDVAESEALKNTKRRCRKEFVDIANKCGAKLEQIGVEVRTVDEEDFMNGIFYHEPDDFELPDDEMMRS